MKKILGKQGGYMLAIAIIMLIFILFLGMLPLELDTDVTETVGDYRYHILVDVGSTSEYFPSEFSAGAQKAAQEKNILLEIAGENSALASGDEKLIQKGIFERVDGIIHTGRSIDGQTQELMDGSDCAVVCVNNECDTTVMSYVGPDNREEGRTVISHLDTDGYETYNVVIIASMVEKELGALRYQGMLEEIAKRPEINVLETIYISSDVLEAMDQTQKSILAYPDIDCFIGTDETILTGIARGVVDLNRVPDIAVAGVGVGADVERYLQKGIIRFTIDPVPYEMGYEAVLKLYEQRSRALPRQSSYTDYSFKEAAETKS